MSNTLYNRLKFITQIALPAAGTLYFTLAGIWNWSSGDEVVGSIVALDTFLGVMLQLSSNAYANSEERFDGAINVAETDDKKTF
ncbi:MAG TPA: phage holin, partial [Anaerolineales bacterium]|nr:phage holin [Anaerolineales bacterium]